MAALLASLGALAVLMSSAPADAQSATPAEVGEWSPIITLPMVGVHLVVMPTGKVFMMSAESHLAGSGTLVWDPATPTTFVDRPSPHANHFCSGHTLLADGRILITGGDLGQGQGILDADIFDPATESWTDAAEMTLARWYPTATMLADGRVLVMGGTNAASQIVNVHEVYNPAVNTWTRLPTSTNMSYRYYPLNFLLPDGRLLVAGSYSDLEPTRALNLTTNAWTTIDGTLRQAGSSVMYLPGKILNAGSRAYQGGTTASVTAARVLDMTAPSPSWLNTGAMAFPRAYHTLTILPDGQVLVTGGTRTGAKSDLAANVHQAEMWSPSTGLWTTMASAHVPQGYHSAAVLLFDGRVFVTGQGRSNGPNDPDANDQKFAEIYSPPYLFNGARPVISSAPSIVYYGSTFAIATADAADISAVSLISLPAVTHGFNENQHFVPLTKSLVAGGLNLQAPVDANLAPPGYYMLFIVNAAGVPSAASLVRIPAVGEDSEAPSSPGSLNASSLSGSVGLDWVAATDNVAVAVYNIHRSTADGFTPEASTRIGQSAVPSYVDTSVPTDSTFYYRVTAQDAKGNVSLPSNQASAAPLPVIVPSVVGLTQGAASTALSGVGLTVGAVSTMSSDTIPAGNVISQTPAAGVAVPVGTVVALLVSSGVPPVAVPNVVGLTQAAASAALVGANLSAGTITSAASATVPSGSVISQSPLAGASVPPGSAVALTISTGPSTSIQVANVRSALANSSSSFIDLAYTVPNLPGQDLLLVVQAGSEASTTGAALPVSATFHGRTLTRAGAIRTPASGTNNGSGIFWLPVQPNETGTIRLTFTGTCIERGIGAATLVGANLVGPTVVETATGTASVTDVITTTTPNALVMSTATQGNAGVLTATGTGHVRDFNVGPASSQVAGGHAVAATPATLTLGYSASNINRIAMVLAAFRVSAPTAPPVPVPNVVGLTQAAASAALVGASLTAGTITSAASATVPSGSVISQSPLAGASVPPGSAVALTISTGPATTTLERRVSSSSDDAEQKGTSLDLSSSDLELVMDGSTQIVGIRFATITIPQGWTIQRAWIQFQADETQSETTNLTLEVQAIDNAPTFTSSSNNISSRSRTGSVAWSSVPAWGTVGQAGTNQRTPDITSLVQAVVSRPGWSSGKALAIIITGSGHRTAESFDGTSSGAPLLHIEY